MHNRHLLTLDIFENAEIARLFTRLLLSIDGLVNFALVLLDARVMLLRSLNEWKVNLLCMTLLVVLSQSNARGRNDAIVLLKAFVLTWYSERRRA